MIKLKTLKEEFDRYELEDLTGKEAILKYLMEHGEEPEVVEVLGQEMIIWDKYIIDDPNDYPWVYEKDNWIYDSHSNNIINELSDMLEEKRNKLFWEYPKTLYHATPKENIQNILSEGLKRQHQSRSLTNRHITGAVFTTTEPDEVYNPAYSTGWMGGGPYGDALFAIRTDVMKADGFMPELSKEPAFAEQDARNYLAKKIKLWDYDKDLVDSGDGTSDNTIIIYSHIPPKYLSLVEHA